MRTEMNDTSQTMSCGANGSSVSVARVHALEHDDARIVAQPRVELPVADVDGDHARRAALEQDVGEAAGRGADVEAVEPGRVDAEQRRAPCASFSPPRETYAGPRSTLARRSSSTCWPGLS